MDEKIRHSYCLQELSDMKDPRQLTCTHIFCMSCIRSDSKQESAVKCPIHGTVTDVVDLDTLDNPSENNLPRKPEVQVTEYKCNRCKDNTAAVSYCLECGDLLCDKHLQMHQDYFKTSHTITEVQVYARNAAAYTKIPCIEHKTSKISHVCGRCCLLACSECNPQNCPKDSAQGDHHFHTLCRIAEDFKKEFDELLKGCTDKVTEICKLEKETWFTLDSLIEKCQKMVADVQKRTEEQIAEIRGSSQQLIQQIHDYQVDRTNRVQVFVSDLLMKREELEQLQKSVRHLIQNCSVVEKIQQKEEKISALKEGKEMVIKPFDWEEMALLELVSQQKSEFCLARVPSSSLTYLMNKETPYGSQCRSVCFTFDGQLQVACDEYLDQHCHGTLEIIMEARDMNSEILSLAALESGELLYLGKDGNIYRSREPYNSSIILFNVSQATRITTCRNDVFVLSKLSSTDKLTKYNLQSKVKKEYNFNSTEIVSICCHPDGDLLAVSKQSGVLYKYRVDEEKKVLEQIWSCNELPGAYAVCTDKCGWIYVAARGSRIYVVSEGKIYRCLESDKLTECEDPEYGDIAVYDDTLVAIESVPHYFNMFSLKQE